MRSSRVIGFEIENVTEDINFIIKHLDEGQLREKTFGICKCFQIAPPNLDIKVLNSTD